MSNANWFPGADFPDREVWLARRSTPRNLVRYLGRTIQNKGPDGELRPIMLGINNVKRMARIADLLKTGRPFGPRHQEIVRQRHAYYRRAAT